MQKIRLRTCHVIVLLFLSNLIGVFLSNDKAFAQELIKVCNFDHINISGLASEQEKYKELALIADERNLDWITTIEAMQMASSYLDDLHAELEKLQNDYNQLTIKLNEAIDELNYETVRLTFAQYKMWSLVKEVYHAQKLDAPYSNKAIKAWNSKNAYDFEYEEVKNRVSEARANLKIIQKAIDTKYNKANYKSEEIAKAQDFYNMVAYIEAKALVAKNIAEQALLIQQNKLSKNMSSKVNRSHINCKQITDSEKPV